MCELFAMSSKKAIDIHDYLQEFYSHSRQHPHGWGMACIDQAQVQIEKEPIQAIKSHYLKHRLSVSIDTPIVLGHIRYATIGHIEYVNCHPYTMKDRFHKNWTLIHNGTIFHYQPLEKYVNIQKGSTDSERILMYFIDKLNEQDHKLDQEECFTLFDHIICDMSLGNKLNLILTDGKSVYVHTNYAHSLYFLKKDGAILFSTHPLSQEKWKPVFMTTLLAYQGDKLIYNGVNHQHQYFDTRDNTKYLYQIFSDL